MEKLRWLWLLSEDEEFDMLFRAPVKDDTQGALCTCASIRKDSDIACDISGRDDGQEPESLPDSTIYGDF